MSEAEPSYGMKAVGITFNPSGDIGVALCKTMAARSIDQIDEIRRSSTSIEQKRLCSIAITQMQTAQMWAVKALTWKD